MTATNSMSAAFGLRTLTARPNHEMRAAAKAISRLNPAIVVPAAADPAVLVDLHADLRLSLTTLARNADITLPERYAVTALATGCIELVPMEDVDGASLDLRVDPRQRLRLTKGIAHRLTVPVGGQVLITCHAPTRTLRLISLAALADAFDSAVTADAGTSVRPGQDA